MATFFTLATGIKSISHSVDGFASTAIGCVMPIWGWICVSIVILLAGVIIYYAIVIKNLEKRHEAEGELMVGWIVQANNILYQPGSMASWAQILVAFDEPEFPDPHASVLALSFAELKDGQATTADEKKIAKLVRDERAMPNERFRLPKTYTRGREIYSMHVMVERYLLPKGYLHLPFVRVSVIRDDANSRVLMRKYKKSDLQDFEEEE
jgi:hypothetical protein